MKNAILSALFMICACAKGLTQYTYQPPELIDLSIHNISQETRMWCWAATAQQIIYWINGYAPSQCQLVAYANQASEQYCCTYPHLCEVPGSMQQIQNLILAYGGRYSSIEPPANEMIIYQTLAKGRPIVLFLQTHPTLGHFIVLRGMSWIPTYNGYQAVLYVNDPMSYFTQPVPFYDLLGIWKAAIVVY